MVKVAVAGGAANIGRHLVEEILATKKHDVVVLSRTATHPELEALGARIVAVDYANSASLVSALEGVHTVISALPALEPASQLALIDASVEAGVKRFAPSEWALRSIPNNPIEFYRPKWEVVEAARKSGLEYTLYEVGIFMNYLAVGTPGLGHLKPVKFLFDVENCTAQLPGDGSTYMVFTRAEDVGKFVAASLDLEKWPECSQMIGDRKSLKEVLKLVEEIRGKPFDVTYTSKETYEERLVKEVSPSLARYQAQVGIDILTNKQWGYATANLNDSFPEIKSMDMETFLRKWWA